MEPMTLEEFLKNPAGKGSSSIVGRELIFKDLENRFEKLLARRERKRSFDHHLLYDKKSDSYFFHIIVPTESDTRTNNYDVIIEFYKPDIQMVSNDTGLSRYHMRMFSNMPSFTFTYAHVFYANELMISGGETRYDEIVIDKKPDIRNPFFSASYEKSLVFSMLYIKTYLTTLYNSKQRFIKNATKWDPRYFLAIRTSEEILAEYKKESNKAKRTRKKSSGRMSRKSSKQPRGSSATGVVKPTRGVKKSRGTRSTRSTRKPRRR